MECAPAMDNTDWFVFKKYTANLDFSQFLNLFLNLSSYIDWCRYGMSVEHVG